MNHVAKGTFTVKLAPLPFEGQAEGSALGRMSIDKQISGDLTATTAGQMLSAGTQTKGSAGTSPSSASRERSTAAREASCCSTPAP